MKTKDPELEILCSGQTLTVSEWAAKLNIPKQKILDNIGVGWRFEEKEEKKKK